MHEATNIHGTFLQNLTLHYWRNKDIENFSPATRHFLQKQILFSEKMVAMQLSGVQIDHLGQEIVENNLLIEAFNKVVAPHDFNWSNSAEQAWSGKGNSLPVLFKKSRLVYYSIRYNKDAHRIPSGVAQRFEQIRILTERIERSQDEPARKTFKDVRDDILGELVAEFSKFNRSDVEQYLQFENNFSEDDNRIFKEFHLFVAEYIMDFMKEKGWEAYHPEKAKAPVLSNRS